MPYSSRVYPVLFHFGALVIPAYGVAAAVGVLLALLLAQRTARIAGVNAAQIWNLCIVSLFAALIGSRILLAAANWREIAVHPALIFSLGMVHHPLVGVAGAAAGVAAAMVYARRQRLDLWNTADALGAPMALGLSLVEIGALLAGSGYGVPSVSRWAVTYTSILAELWSGTPLGVPLHPVQAYAALAHLTIAAFLLVWLPMRRQAGDVAGLWLMTTGAAIFLTELWRDSEGRGSFLGGALDGPQLAGVAMVLAGGAMLRQRSGMQQTRELEERPADGEPVTDR
jgi:phosphatidylglycerol:prolipoprotein diacylglycerol transferase